MQHILSCRRVQGLTAGDISAALWASKRGSLIDVDLFLNELLGMAQIQHNDTFRIGFRKVLITRNKKGQAAFDDVACAAAVFVRATSSEQVDSGRQHLLLDYVCGR